MLFLRNATRISANSQNSLDMRLAFLPYVLKFRHPAGTSRGVLTEKPTYLLKVYDENNPGVFGLGEASIFPGLSTEADGRYEFKLIELLANIAIGKATDLSRHPSIQFGLEQALLDFASGGKGIYHMSEFTQGTREIPINGLIWMGSMEEMRERIARKIDEGFDCLKLKVGALDWNQEFELLKSVRKEFPDLEIRLDANGGFPEVEVLSRLRQLYPLRIHSLEQPVKPGNPDLMAAICRKSEIPIALDESLIGMHSEAAKRMLLDYIAPQYIILKPTLCGGFSGARQWIDLANERGVGWWVTSALESNVGLNALAQWTATLHTSMRQGLGTGLLYSNNFPSPLHISKGNLGYNPNKTPWDRAELAALPWRE